MKLKIAKYTASEDGLNKKIKNFSQFANFMTNWVSGETGVDFFILNEDEGYCSLIETLYKSESSDGEILDSLKKYVENNY